ncbi:MAG: (Fe-S)-binding protein [Methanobrevibacter sp.]|jgi:Fe-S oxidoreductase|nr:(Fe-S)-binding protein [Candidatus Methanovirga procula]
MLYFKGCTGREKLRNIPDSVEKLLNMMGIDYYTLDNEGCCGSFLLRTGFEEDAKNVMKKNLDEFKNQKILTSCAGCYKTLKKDYKKYFKTDLDVVHISQLLRDLINESELKGNKELSKYSITVTYHDPCHLGRHSGEYDAPREIIRNFANLKEMENIRENSICCGSGGGVKSAYPEISKEIAISRVKEAEDIGAELILTSCPFCKLNLSENSSIEVLDISEFILNCISNKKENWEGN